MRILVLVRAIALCCAGPLPAFAESPPLEYQVKASMLFNFLQFVEWPPDSNGSGPLKVCTVKPNRFGPALKALESELVRGRPVSTAEVEDASQASGCHLLFVPDGAEVSGLPGTGVLVVGETPGFLNRGGMINFTIEGGRLRFEINEKAAFAARLVLSSKLLELATHVERR